MNATDLLHFLGHSPAEPEFEAWLTANRVYSRPHTAQDDYDYKDEPDKAERNAADSEVEEAEHAGFCLIYDDSENYRRLYGETSPAGAFVLMQVAFFAQDTQSYQGFQGELPAGLQFNLARKQVRQLLGKPLACRKVKELNVDLFLHGDVLLDVSYLGGEAGVGIVHARGLHRFDRCMLGRDIPRKDPTALDSAALARLLGGSAYSPALEALLAPLGWSSQGEQLADADDVLNLMQQHGITLYYRDASEFNNTLKIRDFPGDHAVFAGFRLNRAGDMHSNGFEGELPLHMEFHHTPQQLRALFQRAPDWESSGGDTAAMRWDLPHCSLHLMYSLLDWQLYRVTVFAPFTLAHDSARHRVPPTA